MISDALKEAREPILLPLQILFNNCLSTWENDILIILYKKGDPTKLENYRPISLLSRKYKLLTKIVARRLTGKLEFPQLREQVGFRHKTTIILSQHLSICV